MKAIWKGTIGLGLVTIPVKMFSAVQESELDPDMFDGKYPAHSLATEQQIQVSFTTARRRALQGRDSATKGKVCSSAEIIAL